MNWFWFRPESPANLAVARILLAGTALWVALSRPTLPSLLEGPSVLWMSVPPERRLRFLLVFDPRLEWILWYVLLLALALTMAGVATRWMALASALLLYHFAPLETILRNGNPYLRGFTIPALGLLIVAAAPSGGEFLRRRPADERAPAWQHRWPLALIEVLFFFLYFFAAYSKFFTSGMSWLSSQNIRNYILAIDQALGFTARPSLGLWIADHPLLCTSTAVAGIAIELSFPLVLFSPTARRVLIPLLIVFHLLNAAVFRIMFQDIWLLLIFVDWQALAGARRMAAS